MRVPPHGAANSAAARSRAQFLVKNKLSGDSPDAEFERQQELAFFALKTAAKANRKLTATLRRCHDTFRDAVVALHTVPRLVVPR